jgi:excisionase family DNA binding protein
MYHTTPIKEVVQEVLAQINYNEYLTPEDIGNRLKIDPGTVRKWCREGTLPFAKFGGKLIRIKTTDFIKFCEEYQA